MAATAKRPEIIELSRGLRGIPQCDDYERMISGMMYVLIYIYIYILICCEYIMLTSQVQP